MGLRFASKKCVGRTRRINQENFSQFCDRMVFNCSFLSHKIKACLLASQSTTISKVIFLHWNSETSVSFHTLCFFTYLSKVYYLQIIVLILIDTWVFNFHDQCFKDKVGVSSSCFMCNWWGEFGYQVIPLDLYEGQCNEKVMARVYHI